MKYSETHLTTNDSANLFVRTYTPARSERCSRTLVVVHGTSEHSGRYQHVAEDAVSRGWDVVIPDLRGHGRSDGVAVHIDEFDRYLHDLDTLWQYFELNPEQTAVVGHSFGGLVSIRFAQTRPARLAALAAMSPLLGLNVEIDPLTYTLGQFMSYVAPKTRFKSKVHPGHTTRNPEVLEHRLADPLIHRSVTASWFFEMKKGLRRAWEEADALDVPILAMQAGDDRIVDADAVEPWLSTTSSSDRSFRLFDGHYHELLNEPEWQDTLAELMSWLDARLPCAANASVDESAN